MFEIINKCSKCKIINISNKSINGSYGSIYFGKSKSGKNIAIKVIKVIKKKIKNTLSEVNFYLLMDKNKIGPKIYDIFFITDNFNNYVQFILMEQGDASLSNVFISNHYSIEQKKIIVFNMINVIKIQFLKLHLYCTDVKPDNFILFKKNLSVKAIDFGKHFCNLKKLPKPFKRNQLKLFTMTMLLQIFMMIHNFSNIPLPFLSPFFNDDMFLILFENIDFTKQFIIDIIKNYSSDVYDVGFIFKYYIKYKHDNLSDEELINYIFFTLDMYLKNFSQ
jgi:serine/threonine protein kinase